MTKRSHARETEKVVQRVLKTVARYRAIGKKEFEAILHEVRQQVQEHTRIEPGRIAGATGKVIGDLPREYGRLAEAERSWEALIAYLYTKYLKELGALK